MTMIVGVPRETALGERRVALVPELVTKLAGAGLEVRIEPGSGVAAGFPDAAYLEKGARLASEGLAGADIVLKVQPPARRDVAGLKEGAVLIGFLAPYANAEGIQALVARRVTAFAMELMPRIT